MNITGALAWLATSAVIAGGGMTLTTAVTGSNPLSGLRDAPSPIVAADVPTVVTAPDAAPIETTPQAPAEPVDPVAAGAVGSTAIADALATAVTIAGQDAQRWWTQVPELGDYAVFAVDAVSDTAWQLSR